MEERKQRGKRGASEWDNTINQPKLLTHCNMKWYRIDEWEHENEKNGDYGES